MRKLRLLLVLVLAPFFISTVYGQKTISRIDKKGEFRVGMTGDQPPFSMKDKYGTWMGFEVDLAEALATSMGVELKIVELSFTELIPALEDKKVDAVMSGLTITPARNSKVFFAGPYSVSGKSILTKSQVLAQIASADEINETKYKVSCLKGSTSEAFVKELMPNAELVAVESVDEGVNLVMNDSVQAMVADFPTCVVATMMHAENGLVTLDQPLTIEPIGIALPADDPQLLNLVENYLKALELTSAMEMLDMKWFQDGTWLQDLE